MSSLVLIWCLVYSSVWLWLQATADVKCPAARPC